MSERVHKPQRPVRADRSRADLRVGAQVAYCYRVVRELASGGMSQLYLVEHLPSGSDAALKVSSIRSSRMLAREHALLARVQHSNIVRSFELGRLADDSEYLVLELIPGADLAAWTDCLGALPREKVLRVLWQLASAVDHIHACGIVHSDIKPSNIMLNVHDEHLTLIDFGVAFDLATERAQRGSTGTPGYMAPEQLRGEGCGPEADRYAVAAVALELLGLSKVSRIGAGPRIIGRANAAVQSVLRRGLHCRPEARYPTARAFVLALTRALGASVAKPKPRVLAPVAPSANHANSSGDACKPSSALVRLPTDAPDTPDATIAKRQRASRRGVRSKPNEIVFAPLAHVRPKILQPAPLKHAFCS